MSLAAGGRTLHLPGLSTIKQSEPVEEKPNKKHLLLFSLAAIIIAVLPLVMNIFTVPAVEAQKQLNELAGPQGEGFLISDVGRDYSYLPISMVAWFGAFILEILLVLIFAKINGTTAARYFKQIFGSIFTAFTLTSTVILIVISGGYSNTNDQFKDWAKEKYQLSEVGSFSPSAATLEGKDASGNTVKLNVVHDGNVFYLYQDKGELLKIAQDMLQSEKS